MFSSTPGYLVFFTRATSSPPSVVVLSSSISCKGAVVVVVAITGLPLSVGRYYSPPVFFKIRKLPLKDAKRFEGTVADPEKGFCGLLLLPSGSK